MLDILVTGGGPAGYARANRASHGQAVPVVPVKRC